jgi:hypothetical protein
MQHAFKVCLHVALAWYLNQFKQFKKWLSLLAWLSLFLSGVALSTIVWVHVRGPEMGFCRFYVSNHFNGGA